MARQATDTFTVLIDGAPIGVSLGDILPEGDPVLKHLDQVAPGNNLFKQLVEDSEAPPAVKAQRATPGPRAGKAAG